jgi:hypothetical protein
MSSSKRRFGREVEAQIWSKMLRMFPHAVDGEELRGLTRDLGGVSKIQPQQWEGQLGKVWNAYEASPNKGWDLGEHFRGLMYDNFQGRMSARQVGDDIGQKVSQRLARPLPPSWTDKIMVDTASGPQALTTVKPGATVSDYMTLKQGRQITTIDPAVQQMADGQLQEIGRDLNDGLNRASQVQDALNRNQLTNGMTEEQIGQAKGKAADGVSKIKSLIHTVQTVAAVTIAGAGAAYLAKNLLTPPPADAQKAGNEVSPAFTDAYGEQQAGVAPSLQGNNALPATPSQQYQIPEQPISPPPLPDPTSATPNSYMPQDPDEMNTVTAISRLRSVTSQLASATPQPAQPMVNADAENMKLREAADGMRAAGIPTYSQFYDDVQGVLGNDFGQLSDQQKEARLSDPKVQSMIQQLTAKYESLASKASQYMTGLNLGSGSAA